MSGARRFGVTHDEGQPPPHDGIGTTRKTRFRPYLTAMAFVIKLNYRTITQQQLITPDLLKITMLS
jgi:hypothetical protein